MTGSGMNTFWLCFVPLFVAAIAVMLIRRGIIGILPLLKG